MTPEANRNGSSADALLPQTFVHIAGIGLKTECRLWRSGVRSWADLAGTPLARRPATAAILERSEEAFEDSDSAFFFSALPAAERWRAFADFGSRFLALDIETTGMSHYDQITVIGTEIDGEYRTFIRGSNLEEAAELISDSAGLITFNGALFDLPFLRRTFPDLELPQAHVDLRFLGRRVGLAGPLKTVEELAELTRDAELHEVDGYEATVLWGQVAYGDSAALEQLVLYNAADTCVLRPLAGSVVDRLGLRLQELRAAPIEGELPFSEPAPRTKVRHYSFPTLPAIRRVNGHLRVGPRRVRLPERATFDLAIDLGGLQSRMRDPEARIVGIDLTGSEQRPSGWALLEGALVVSGMLSDTEEIIERTLAVKPRLVSIDSPLSLPTGRDCTDDDCSCRAIGGIMRHCERELKRRGVNVYPCLIRSMQALTRRGIKIASLLREAGVQVIESYPGAAQDVMHIPRKRASQEQLRVGLERFGIRGIRASGMLTHDELDAITSAAVGVFYLGDAYEALGNEDEDYLIIPSAIEGQSATGDVRPPPSVTRYLVGPGAAEATDVASAGISTLRDWAAYWRVLATEGAKARAAYVGAADERLSRRPSFADLALSVNDPNLVRQLGCWWRTWEDLPCL